LRQVNMPGDFVLLNRLQWGLWPILAILGARNNWHRIHRELLEDAPPATALGEADAEFRSRWRRERGVPPDGEVWLTAGGPRWAAPEPDSRACPDGARAR
jgi:hypothetical protein